MEADAVNAQYKKGVLELCVLALLSEGDRYGYEISERLGERIGLAGSTVYPILRRLEADGLLTSYLGAPQGGAPRKYYALTGAGLESYRAARGEYLQFAEAAASFLRPAPPAAPPARIPEEKPPRPKKRSWSMQYD
jgi:PadR family transcriptional regulator PadR